MIYFWVVFAIIGFAAISLICAQVWYYFLSTGRTGMEQKGMYKSGIIYIEGVVATSFHSFFQ